jgi:hypothetical protein
MVVKSKESLQTEKFYEIEEKLLDSLLVVENLHIIKITLILLLIRFPEAKFVTPNKRLK